MSDDLVGNLIAQGLDSHQSGRLADAASLYSRAIALDARAHVAIGMLGTVALQSGEFERAHELLMRASEIEPGDFNYAFNDSLALSALGQVDAAIERVEQALSMAPKDGRALSQLGVLQRQNGRLDDARSTLRRATRHNPEMPEPWINMASVLGEMNLTGEAMTAVRKALRRAPHHPEAHFNLARLLMDQENWEDALQAFEKTIELDDAHVGARASLAKTLIALKRPAEAEAMARSALALDPDDVVALGNLGLALMRQARYAEAEGALRHALACDSDDATAISNLACTLLAEGKLDEGWPLYDRMLDCSPPRRTVLIQDLKTPRWNGADIKGRSLLISAEQGVGEQIMFAGLLDRVRAEGAEVTYACDQRLVPLFERSMPDIRVIPAEVGTGDPGDHDIFIPIGALPRMYCPTVEDLPQRTAFLRPDNDLRKKLRERYRGPTGETVVGISWRSASPIVGLAKNVVLDVWRPIFDLPNCRFVSVQYGDATEEIAATNANLGLDILLDTEIDAIESLEQSAAQIAACDMIISISNATLHIAGACGIETHAIIGSDPNWYWCLEENGRSSWYKSVHNHRQKIGEEWGTLLTRVAGNLSRRFEAPQSRDDLVNSSQPPEE